MTSEHLFSDQLETVMRIECTVETFHCDWLKPLEIMAEEEGRGYTQQIVSDQTMEQPGATKS